MNANDCYVERCWACEGSGTHPSFLYFIPWFPAIRCKRCGGSGIRGVSMAELVSVHFAANRVLRLSSVGDQGFVKCLRGDDAKDLRLSLVELAEAYRVDL